MSPFRAITASSRRVLATLLVLLFALTPAVSIAVEMHEAWHRAAGDAPHVGDADRAACTAGDAHGDCADRGSLLHALSHLGHCCGQIAALLPMPFAAPQTPITMQLIVRGDDRHVPRRLSPPFRPPIRA